MNNFAKNVLEKGEDRKKKNTLIWIIVAVVAISAVVAFLVVRYFSEYDCCCEDLDEEDFDYLEDDDEDEIEETVLEEVTQAATEAAEKAPEA